MSVERKHNMVYGFFTDEALHLIAQVTENIPFLVGNEEFDAVIDDCIDALDGKPLPAHYSAKGFDFPDDMPEDGYYPAMALHYLMEVIDKYKIPLSEKYRKLVDSFFSLNGINFAWDKEKFIDDSFYPLEEDRLEDLKKYREELSDENADSEKIERVDYKIFSLEQRIKEPEKNKALKKLKELIEANGGKDPTEEQFADFEECDA